MNLGIGSGSDFPRPAFGLLCLVVLVLVAVAGPSCAPAASAQPCSPCERMSVPPRPAESTWLGLS